MNLMETLRRLWRHAWLDAGDVQRVLPPDAMKRLGERVTASERLHRGQIRLCIEATLPRSYLWRHVWSGVPLRVVVRQRAVMLFGKLRVWDTERNNGVLIYLLLAERTIEIVADRGIDARVGREGWQAIVDTMGEAFRTGRFEEGLGRAVAEVSALLQQHDPADSDATTAVSSSNELPDAPVLMSE
jgi:uncharacterized membrane protein